MDNCNSSDTGWGSARDPAFLRSARPILELYASYFRPEVRGFDRLPERGPFLVVGNHSGGQTPPDLPVLLTSWWRERGEEEPVYALFHSFFLGLPGVGPLMARAGAVEAGREGAESILRDGGILIDYPGGDYEVFRPWWERNRIEFGGRLGFVRLALRTQVPLVPAVSVGAHETLIVLAEGSGSQSFSDLTGCSESRCGLSCSGRRWGSSREEYRRGLFRRRSPWSFVNRSTGRPGTVQRRPRTKQLSVGATRNSRM